MKLSSFINKSICISIIMFIAFQQAAGQLNGINKINTSSAEQYFKLADLLQLNIEPQNSDWLSLFNSTIYKLMIEGNVLDTSEFKSAMKKVFKPSYLQLSNKDLSQNELHHYNYLKNQTQLKSYINFLKSNNIVDSVKLLLNDYLPKRFQNNEMFPTLYYSNYGSSEATGFGGMVINDLLLSYKIDNSKLGLLSAHESFHSIVSVNFQQALKKNIDYNTSEFSFFFFLQNISEEGIADLIDKPLLLQKNSPIYTETKAFVEKDEKFSIMYIHRIDSLLKSCFINNNSLNQYKNYAEIATAYGQNGGHVPGRFMGLIIKEGGMLEKHIESVQNPISFFLTYNNAAKILSGKYPLLSKESEAYLLMLQDKYLSKDNN